MLDAGESYRTRSPIFLGNSKAIVRLHYDGRIGVENARRCRIGALLGNSASRRNDYRNPIANLENVGVSNGGYGCAGLKQDLYVRHL